MKYLLLRPINASMFNLDVPTFIKVTKEHYHCDIVTSYHQMYLTGSKESLETLVSDNELDGMIIEYTGVYDQVINE